MQVERVVRAAMRKLCARTDPEASIAISTWFRGINLYSEEFTAHSLALLLSTRDLIRYEQGYVRMTSIGKRYCLQHRLFSDLCETKDLELPA